MATEIINLNEVRDVSRRIEAALNEVVYAKERKEIAHRAARFVVFAARARAPRSKRAHYAYHNVANKKTGSVTNQRTKYLPGNLAFSIRVIGGLKRTIRAIIGPRILKSPRSKVYGRSPKNVNAYYAQMIYGSASGFRAAVMAKALIEQETRVLTFIEKEVFKNVKRVAAKYRLQ